MNVEDKDLKYTITYYEANPFIEIPLEEYKELLMTKGKYEEIKANIWINNPVPTINGTNITYENYDKTSNYPYDIKA